MKQRLIQRKSHEPEQRYVDTDSQSILSAQVHQMTYSDVASYTAVNLYSKPSMRLIQNGRP